MNVYAPGQAIVVEYAGGWLTWSSGTSFASPLTARYASMTATSPFDPTADQDRGGRRERSDVAVSTGQPVPLRLLLPAGIELIRSSWFPLAPPRPRRPRRPPTKYELHRVLGPLNRLEAPAGSVKSSRLRRLRLAAI